MHNILLGFHSILRWVVLIAGIIALARAGMGWFGKKPWGVQDRLWGVIFSSALDTQLLLGVIMYFFTSSITRMAMSDFGAAMSDSGLRLFAIEHAGTMLLAVIFGHLGTILPKKVEDARKKHMRAFLWIGLAALFILIGIPWQRPLFPGL